MTSWLTRNASMLLSGLLSLGLIGCGDEASYSQAGSAPLTYLRGTLDFPATIHVYCENGFDARADTRSTGGGSYRFGVGIPVGPVCLFTLSRRSDSGASDQVPILLGNSEGSYSMLVAAKGPEVDLGHILFACEGSRSGRFASKRCRGNSLPLASADGGLLLQEMPSY